MRPHRVDLYLCRKIMNHRGSFFKLVKKGWEQRPRLQFGFQNFVFKPSIISRNYTLL
jgi:hypothetical protein